MLSDRELSALVTRHVMPERKPYAPFATDPGLALEAALKVSHGDLELYRCDDGDLWSAQLNGHIDYRATGAAPARALCLAALRAAGVEVEEDGGGE